MPVTPSRVGQYLRKNRSLTRCNGSTRLIALHSFIRAMRSGSVIRRRPGSTSTIYQKRACRIISCFNESPDFIQCPRITAKLARRLTLLALRLRLPEFNNLGTKPFLEFEGNAAQSHTPGGDR